MILENSHVLLRSRLQRLRKGDNVPAPLNLRVSGEAAAVLGGEENCDRRALDGLFLMLGEQEKKIRKDPAAQTTSLLKEVFGRM